MGNRVNIFTCHSIHVWNFQRIKNKDFKRTYNKAV